MSSFRLSIYIVLPLALGLSLLTGACGVPIAVSAASYAADGGFIAASDKTSTDHLASVVTKKDCAMWRIFRGRQICTERAEGEDPYDVDYNEPQRQVSEDGVQYSPPLRSGADAPAASWDEAAYKTAPQPAPVTTEAPVVVQEPVTAAPAPVPVAAKTTAAPAKPAKKVKSASRAPKKPKPSRGQAAPAS